MQMHIDQMELTETIDAIDFALLVLNSQVKQARIGGMIATRTIEVLQGLKLAFMLAAAKEQRKGRANDDGVVASQTLGVIFDKTIRVKRN
jgi:hypothetical protein